MVLVVLKSTSYSIRDLAQEFDVTPRSLRFYEEKGLLSPRRDGQTRSYNNVDRTRLKLILRGKQLGLTLNESAEIIDMYDPTAGNKKQIRTLISKIREKQQQLLEQQKELTLMLNDLHDAEARCLDALN